MRWYWVVAIVAVFVVLTMWGTSQYQKKKAKARANRPGSGQPCGKAPNESGYYVCVGSKWQSVYAVRPETPEGAEERDYGFEEGNGTLNGIAGG